MLHFEPTTEASEGVTDPPVDTATVTPDDGAAGGTQSDAERFASERATLERDLRAHQARADKAEAALAAASSKPTPEPEAPVSVVSEAPTLEQIRAEVTNSSLRAQSLLQSVDGLKTEFPQAGPSVFSDLGQYESVEALRAAAEADHQRMEALIAPAVKAEVEKRVQPYVEKYGAQGPPDTVEATPTGDPTIEQLGEMSLAQLDALEAEKPGVIQRVETAWKTALATAT